jgi:hypothetical protein
MALWQGPPSAAAVPSLQRTASAPGSTASLYKLPQPALSVGRTSSSPMASALAVNSGGGLTRSVSSLAPSVGRTSSSPMASALAVNAGGGLNGSVSSVTSRPTPTATCVAPAQPTRALASVAAVPRLFFPAPQATVVAAPTHAAAVAAPKSVVATLTAADIMAIVTCAGAGGIETHRLLAALGIGHDHAATRNHLSVAASQPAAEALVALEAMLQGLAEEALCYYNAGRWFAL